ncbi:MAG: hypothetical protein M3Y57_15410 [Acidobacteriota bacterium]|nr:hypothetical protein [Acidobacteriota bacterium]
MRFFVPATTNSRQAEEVYRNVREHVAATIGSMSERRIYRLKYSEDGQTHTALVGSDRHPFGTQPVIAILEGVNGAHYICTQKSGAFEVDPHPVSSNTIIEAEEFSALA